eukprot:PhM_4_TR3429/c0_g1_i1/m.119
MKMNDFVFVCDTTSSQQQQRRWSLAKVVERIEREDGTVMCRCRHATSTLASAQYNATSRGEDLPFLYVSSEVVDVTEHDLAVLDALVIKDGKQDGLDQGEGIMAYALGIQHPHEAWLSFLLEHFSPSVAQPIYVAPDVAVVLENSHRCDSAHSRKGSKRKVHTMPATTVFLVPIATASLAPVPHFQRHMNEVLSCSLPAAADAAEVQRITSVAVSLLEGFHSPNASLVSELVRSCDDEASFDRLLVVDPVSPFACIPKSDHELDASPSVFLHGHVMGALNTALSRSKFPVCTSPQNCNSDPIRAERAAVFLAALEEVVGAGADTLVWEVLTVVLELLRASIDDLKYCAMGSTTPPSLLRAARLLSGGSHAQFSQFFKAASDVDYTRNCVAASLFRSLQRYVVDVCLFSYLKRVAKAPQSHSRESSRGGATNHYIVSVALCTMTSEGAAGPSALRWGIVSDDALRCYAERLHKVGDARLSRVAHEVVCPKTVVSSLRNEVDTIILEMVTRTMLKSMNTAEKTTTSSTARDLSLIESCLRTVTHVRNPHPKYCGPGTEPLDSNVNSFVSEPDMIFDLNDIIESVFNQKAYTTDDDATWSAYESQPTTTSWWGSSWHKALCELRRAMTPTMHEDTIHWVHVIPSHHQEIIQPALVELWECSQARPLACTRMTWRAFAWRYHPLIIDYTDNGIVVSPIAIGCDPDDDDRENTLGCFVMDILRRVPIDTLVVKKTSDSYDDDSAVLCQHLHLGSTYLSMTHSLQYVLDSMLWKAKRNIVKCVLMRFVHARTSTAVNRSKRRTLYVMDCARRVGAILRARDSEALVQRKYMQRAGSIIAAELTMYIVATADTRRVRREQYNAFLSEQRRDCEAFEDSAQRALCALFTSHWDPFWGSFFSEWKYIMDMAFEREFQTLYVDEARGRSTVEWMCDVALEEGCKLHSDLMRHIERLCVEADERSGRRSIELGNLVGLRGEVEVLEALLRRTTSDSLQHAAFCEISRLKVLDAVPIELRHIEKCAEVLQRRGIIEDEMNSINLMEENALFSAEGILRTSICDDEADDRVDIEDVIEVQTHEYNARSILDADWAAFAARFLTSHGEIVLALLPTSWEPSSRRAVECDENTCYCMFICDASPELIAGTEMSESYKRNELEEFSEPRARQELQVLFAVEWMWTVTNHLVTDALERHRSLSDLEEYNRQNIMLRHGCLFVQIKERAARRTLHRPLLIGHKEMVTRASILAEYHSSLGAILAEYIVEHNDLTSRGRADHRRLLEDAERERNKVEAMLAGVVGVRTTTERGEREGVYRNPHQRQYQRVRPTLTPTVPRDLLLNIETAIQPGIAIERRPATSAKDIKKATTTAVTSGLFSRDVVRAHGSAQELLAAYRSWKSTSH